MRRRQFLGFLGSAVAWPLAASAQEAGMPVVGFISSRSPAEATAALQAFRQGLGETGYFEGKNVKIEYRWAEGRYDRLPALAAEMVSRDVAVIAATGGEPSALAAKAATVTTPIVFTLGGDPVEAGLVASLNQPGGNITGTTIMTAEMGSKRLELVRRLLPNADTVAILVNPDFAASKAEAREVQSGASSLGMQFHTLKATTEGEIETAFTDAVQLKADALIVATDALLLGQRGQIVRLAARHSVPTVYFSRDFVDAGGLMSYGPNITNGYRQAGNYTGQILSGANPAKLPILRPTQFTLVLNLKTAAALGLAMPPMLLALADEVIE
jgi:putative tryptophan/tyrosine transport system substrate-binding protein